MSIRTLNRQFREQVGTTPLQWLLSLRVERAKQLLEITHLSVECIADEVGFGSAVASVTTSVGGCGCPRTATGRPFGSRNFARLRPDGSQPAS